MSTPGGLPALGENREAVALDWRAALREQMTQARLEALEARHAIVLANLDVASRNR